jgi:transcriptional regulator with XRE-family HTH domain
MQGERLKEMRQTLQLKQEELAAALQISRVHYGQMERDQKKIEGRTEALLHMLVNNLRHYLSLKRQIELMEAGELHTMEGKAGAPMHDTTAASLGDARERIRGSEATLLRLFGDRETFQGILDKIVGGKMETFEEDDRGYLERNTTQETADRMRRRIAEVEGRLGRLLLD